MKNNNIISNETILNNPIISNMPIRELNSLIAKGKIVNIADNKPMKNINRVIRLLSFDGKMKIIKQ